VGTRSVVPHAEHGWDGFGQVKDFTTEEQNPSLPF
jgi:hypothetical protein